MLPVPGRQEGLQEAGGPWAEPGREGTAGRWSRASLRIARTWGPWGAWRWRPLLPTCTSQSLTGQLVGLGPECAAQGWREAHGTPWRPKGPRTFPSMPMPQSAIWIMLTSFPPSPGDRNMEAHPGVSSTGRDCLRTPSSTRCSATQRAAAALRTPPPSAARSRAGHSPMAHVRLPVCCCSSFTMRAFCVGEQRQHTTAGHWQARSTSSCS